MDECSKQLFRLKRQHEEDVSKSGDLRTAGQHDRDRVLYSNSFRRLSGVTQVVSPMEGIVVHNRLTHSLQVAQVARRLTEYLIKSNQENDEYKDIVATLDPDVVESAALAHDIGHPPFGHVAESELNKILQDEKNEGFEGNAQSFRIVTKLAVRVRSCVGLNLTRATLDSLTKYPWIQDPERSKKKWGAYQSEKGTLDWVREKSPYNHDDKCLEAQIMNWADDVTYAVHDVEDFYRAGIVPIQLLTTNSAELEQFLEKTKIRLNLNDAKWVKHEQSFKNLMKLLPVVLPYHGTRKQQAIIKNDVGSWLITRFLKNTKLQKNHKGTGYLDTSDGIEREVKMLKQLNWHYVIDSPSLKTQQFGYKKVIRELFKIYSDPNNKANELVPSWIKAELGEEPESDPLRMAADIVGSLSDFQAIRMYDRLTGRNSGSIKDWH